MSHHEFSTESEKDYIATKISDRLHDPYSIRFYRKLVEEYPASYLYHILGKVLEVPDGKIRKSRGALFTYLVRKEAKKAEDNPIPKNLPFASE